MNKEIKDQKKKKKKNETPIRRKQNAKGGKKFLAMEKASN